MRACLVGLVVSVVVHVLWHDCLHRSREVHVPNKHSVLKFSEYVAVQPFRETLVLQQDASTNFHRERNVI